MMKIIIIITIVIFIIISPVYAVDSTPAADIKTKLEELKREIASKAAALKLEVNKKLKDKVYIGKVKLKSETSLTLTTDGGPKIVSINQDTQFVSRVKGKKYSQKLILAEDYLAALGDIDEIENLTAKKIILLPTPSSEAKTYLWGQIIAVSDKLTTLKDKNAKNIAVSLTNPSNVKVGDFVILTGRASKNDVFKAEFVYTIPQGGSFKSKKVVYPVLNGAGATPSAKVASTSSTPKTPKPTSR